MKNNKVISSSITLERIGGYCMKMKLETEMNPPVVIKGAPLTYRLSRLDGLKWILLAVPLFYILYLLVLPMFGFFKLSVFDENGFTLKYIVDMFSTTIYLNVIWTTIKTATIVTFITLLISYPFAYYIVQMQSKTWKTTIVVVVTISLWLSIIARTFSWSILLQDQGIINKFLINLGIITEPLPLLYNLTGVIIGMSHILLPYMILNLISVMQGIDTRLIQAAEGLGAKPFRAFLQIYFPLSLPGVISGSLLVFVMSLGYYITPALLGGSKDMMISTLISQNITRTLNWNLAATLALFLFIITLLLLLLSYFLVRKNPVLTEVE